IITIDEVDNSALRLKFPPSPPSGSFPVTVEELSKTYGDHVVFQNANMLIKQGEKVAFVGKNGEGKSTMIKAIIGEIDVEGKMQIGHNIKIGYFAQKQSALVDGDLTVFKNIDQIAVGDVRVNLKDQLEAFILRGDDT